MAAGPNIRRMNYGGMADCLKTKHNVYVVGDAEKLAETVRNVNHRESDEYECRTCMEIENTTGCMQPHSCLTRVKDMFDTLLDK